MFIKPKLQFVKFHNKTTLQNFPAVSKPHRIHLQHHLLECTAYTIIVKHKQIGWATIK